MIRWSDQHLSALRADGDPAADAVARAILGSGDLARINGLMRQLSGNPQVPSAALPPEVRAWLAETGDLPAWVDAARVERGQRVFVRYGVPILQGLLYRSLPEVYACADGVQVLARSKRITALVDRRVLETLRFVVDVLTPGHLAEGAVGVRTAQRVRLLHASIRLHLAAGGFPADRFGPPINQEDLVITLASFSVVILDVLRRFGAELSEAEADGWLHTWNVIGWIMGVREELLFESEQDGDLALRMIRRRHHRACPEGQAVMAALLGFMNDLVPGELFDGISASMVRFLGGDALADLLGVPPADWTRHFLRLYRRAIDAADDVQDLGPMGRRLAELLGGRLLQALIEGRHGVTATFDLPADLRANWQL
ncbi:MAG: DUF2236 domain-containing protein [Myxococcales bacterium]|nr:DUF2236 domain-containing protein [Myxococcales bacterium]